MLRSASVARLFGCPALRRVEFVVVVESVLQKSLDENGAGNAPSESRGIVAQRGFEFCQDFRSASGRVNAPHLGFELRGSDFEAIDSLRSNTRRAASAVGTSR